MKLCSLYKSTPVSWLYFLSYKFDLYAGIYGMFVVKMSQISAQKLIMTLMLTLYYFSISKKSNLCLSFLIILSTFLAHD